MDSSSLSRSREEVVYSREWEELNRELASQLQHLEYLQGGGQQFRSFTSLSDREKLAAVGKVTRALEKTRAFNDLQVKVTATLDRHFSSISQQPAVGASSSAEGLQSPDPAGSIADVSILRVSKACSYLLAEWPHLKRHLKRCFNHPLPSQLRAIAWKLLLPYPAVQKDFLTKALSQGGFPELSSEEKRVARRCEVLLSSDPAFHEMADSVAVLKAMKSITLYWSARSGSVVPDTALILCIPFLYVRREELSQWRSEGSGRTDNNWALVAEIAEPFVSFMEMLPLTMHSVTEDVSTIFSVYVGSFSNGCKVLWWPG